jgi:uncharacterized membrane protein HdeD (DUF308 family)
MKKQKENRMATTLLDVFERHWWLWLLRGVFAVAFGVMAFTLPELTLKALVLLFGIYALVDGLAAIGLGVAARAWWLLLLGAIGVFVAVSTFVRPDITAVALLYLIAGLAIARGVFEIVTAIELRKLLSNEWLLALSGVLSIAFGVVLAANRETGALAVIWIVGAYAVATGILILVLAFRLRALIQRLEKFA